MQLCVSAGAPGHRAEEVAGEFGAPALRQEPCLEGLLSYWPPRACILSEASSLVFEPKFKVWAQKCS